MGLALTSGTGSFIPGGIYHVYNRVSRGEPVFEEACEAERWIDTVADVARLFDLTIFGWCLMASHFHLAVRTGTSSLWCAMARVQNPEAAATGSLDFEGKPVPPEPASRPGLSALLGFVESELDIPAGRLAGRTRSRLVAWHRGLFTTLAVNWFEYPVREVADVLRKSTRAISR